MKRHLLTFVALVCSLMVSAYDFEQDLIYYNITSESTVEVTHANKVDLRYEGVVNIPVFVAYRGKSYYVTSIGNYAFSNCSSLTSVTIAGVTSIGAWAFSNCSSLTIVTLPAGLTSIGYMAFNRCSSLTNLTIPESVTSIGLLAFCCCSSLTSITIPAGVTSIGESAFDGCSSLTSVTLPAGLTSIGPWAFRDCSSLTSIMIPESVTTIEESAFRDCSSLTSITIPAGVTSIGDYAFHGCENLKTVINFSVLDITKGADTHGEVALYADKVLTLGVNLDHTELTMLEDDKAVLEATVIPEGSVTWSSSDESVATVDQAGHVIAVGPGTATITATAGNYSATCTVTVEPRWSFDAATGHLYVDKDYDYGYSGWSNYPWHSFRESIKSVEFSSNVTSIGYQAMAGCPSLTNVTIPEGVTSIGYQAFRLCTSLTNITIPAGVTSIGAGAFADCSSLTSVTLPESVTSIGSQAFDYCTSLTNISIPEGVTSIGFHAFYRCSSFPSIITIPEGMKSIGDWAFYGCDNLKTVINLSALDIVKGAETHGGVAYYADKVLTPGVYLDHTELTMQEDDKILLEAIVIPEGSVTWSSSAESVATVDQAGHVTAVGPGTATITATAGNYSATCMVTVEPRWTFDAATGHLYVDYDYEYWSVQDYPWDSFRESIKSVELSSNVTRIGDYAFHDCSSLTSITIPAGVTSIGRSVFYGCSSLTSITLPAGLTSIGEWAFCDCSSLTSVTIPADVTSIGRSVFYGCSSLTSVTLPAGLTSIGEETFEGCSSLTSITIPDNVTSIGDWAFWCCDNLKTVINLSALDIVKGSDTHGYVAYYADKVLTPGVYLDHTELTMQEDDKILLEAIVIPEGSVTWSSSAESVATVDQAGHVTAVGPGTATITATAGNYSATCMVTVEPQKPSYTPADVNNDGQFAVDDVVLTINAALGIMTDNFQFAAADMNGDGEIFVDDVVMVINSVLGISYANVLTSRSMMCDALDVHATESGFNMNLTRAVNYTAMQFDMHVPAGVSIEDIQVTASSDHVVASRMMDNGVVRVIVTSLSNETFCGNQLLSVKVSAEDSSTIVLDNAYAATRSGSLVTLADAEVTITRSGATAIQPVGAGFAPTDIYDLSGRIVKANATSVEGLQKGVYLMNSRKVVVK